MTLSIAGGRESNNSFLLNGIETRNARFGSAGIRPTIEAIQEFKIQRSTFGAEFGRSAAVVNTTLQAAPTIARQRVRVLAEPRSECERLLPESHRPRQAAAEPAQLRDRGRRSRGDPEALQRPQSNVLVLQLRRLPAAVDVQRHGPLSFARATQGQSRRRQRRNRTVSASSALCQANPAIAQVRRRARSTRPACRSPAT